MRPIMQQQENRVKGKLWTDEKSSQIIEMTVKHPITILNQWLKTSVLSLSVLRMERVVAEALTHSPIVYVKVTFSLRCI